MNFREEKHPCESLFIEAMILNLANTITLNDCMFVFDNLNSNF